MPIGDVEVPLLKRLGDELQKILGMRCSISDFTPLPRRLYRASRDQYLSTGFLEMLERVRVPKQTKILGITNVDFYVPNLNFVFGEARCGGNVAVVSTSRLLSGIRVETNDFFLERLLKEAVHELGHTFGLIHCPDSSCVMFFSNTLADTDGKDHSYCMKCLNRLDSPA